MLRGMHLVAVAVIFGLACTANIAVGLEPDSSWSMESGIRLEGGWPENSCVIKLDDATYRMYFNDVILSEYPLGAIIKSAVSVDGLAWTVESGTRVGYGNGGETGYAGGPAVIPLSDVWKWSMYYCNMWTIGPGELDHRGNIVWAVSMDGLEWTKQIVVVDYGGTYDSLWAQGPEVIKLTDGTYRMYYEGFDGTHYRILSAWSQWGLIWYKESGVRIDIGGTYDSLHALHPSVIRVPDGRYIMFYAGCTTTYDARILSAVSTDGLTWTKEPGVRIDRGSYAGVYPDTIIQLSADQYRMYITADRYPIWDNRMRILSAIYPALPPIGGIVVPIDKFGLLAPYIGAAAIVAVGAVVATKRYKRKK